MSFKVFVHTWETDTRPCDFYIVSRHASRRDVCRVCWRFTLLRYVASRLFRWIRALSNGRRCVIVNVADSRLLIDAVRDSAVNNEPMRNLIRRYFTTKSAIIWIDALTEYELVDGESRIP